MQLQKTWMLAVLSAMGMMMAACGGGRTSADLTCTADTDCVEGEICHAGAKVCVQSCTIGADCPGSAKTCAAGTGAETRMFCNCATNELCQQDTRVDDASALSCSAAKVCVPSGATPSGCTTNADCTGGQTCDAGTCKTPTTGQTCSGEGQTTCSYGQFCSSSKCAAVPAPTCENYQNFTQRSELGTSGSIIFKASTVSAAIDSFCSGSTPKRVKVNVSAYSSTPFPETKDGLNGLFYVRVAGTKTDGAATISSSAGNYTVTGTNRERVDFVMSLCVASDSSTLSLGLYFTAGNFFCYQANY